MARGQGSSERLIRWLLIYRWATLILPLATLLFLSGVDCTTWLMRVEDGLTRGQEVVVLLLATAASGLLVFFEPLLRRIAERRPSSIVFDLLFMIGLVALTGGEKSPYLLHSFTPVFSMAIFAPGWGGWFAGGLFALLLPIASWVNHLITALPVDLLLITTYGVGLLLTAPLIGVVSRLWRDSQAHSLTLARMSEQLADKNEILSQTNRQLLLLQQLTLALEEASDPVELQEQLLVGLVDGLGLARAVVALYEPDQSALTGWLSRGGSSGATTNHATVLPLQGGENTLGSSGGPIRRAMSEQREIQIASGEAPTADSQLNGALGLGEDYRVFPMHLRGQPVGVLLIDYGDEETESRAQPALPHVVSHAAVALGSLHLCIDRAQNVAVDEERHRIAADVHDTVSQSLFGLAYGLNAATEMLPEQPPSVGQVKDHLAQMQPLVFSAIQQLRGAIMDLMPGDLGRERFINTLKKQFRALSLGQPIELSISVTHDYNLWPLNVRQQLQMIVYEGLANAARHAKATHVTVELDTDEDGIKLVIGDNGSGADLSDIPSVPGMGIESLRARVSALDGELTLSSEPSRGVTLVVRIPLAPNQARPDSLSNGRPT